MSPPLWFHAGRGQLWVLVFGHSFFLCDREPFLLGVFACAVQIYRRSADILRPGVTVGSRSSVGVAAGPWVREQPPGK